MLTFKKVTLPLAATVLSYAISAESAFAATVKFIKQGEFGPFITYEYLLDYDRAENPAQGDKLTFTLNFKTHSFRVLNENPGKGEVASDLWDPLSKFDTNTVTWTRNEKNPELNVAGIEWQTFEIIVRKAAGIKANAKGLKWNFKGVTIIGNGDINGPSIPEPLTILGTGFAAAALPALKRANKKAKK